MYFMSKYIMMEFPIQKSSFFEEEGLESSQKEINFLNFSSS